MSVATVVERLVASRGGVDATSDDVAEALNPTVLRSHRAASSDTNPGIMVDGSDDVWVKLAKCTPVPGDEIVGFVTRGHGVSVHRRDCNNLPSMEQEPQRFVSVHWNPRSSASFLVNIQVEALDRSALLSDVTRMLSDQHVNILSASGVHVQGPHRAVALHLRDGRSPAPGAVINAVRGVEGVYDAYRV